MLEIRPPVRADKGTAVTQLLGDAGLGRALYAGDDTTDIDAFRALDGLELGIRVAVSSDEAPSELVDAADVVVDSPAELLTLLQTQPYGMTNLVNDFEKLAGQPMVATDSIQK